MVLTPQIRWMHCARGLPSSGPSSSTVIQYRHLVPSFGTGSVLLASSTAPELHSNPIPVIQNWMTVSSTEYQSEDDGIERYQYRMTVGEPFPSYRAHNGPRGERAHLRPTTQKPNMLIENKFHKEEGLHK